MSMLGSMLRAMRSLTGNGGCMVCGEPVTDAMRGVCIKCRYDIPLTNFCKEHDNLVREFINNFVPVEQASSFIFFNQGDWRTLIHRFKYGSEWRIAYDMGVWYGSELKASGLYDDVDIVVPVPLHWRRTMRRGYNQSAYLAKGIASQLGLKVENRAVCRIHNNPAQALKPHDQRWENVENIFRVRKPELLAGRHILLVDDVLTTGATLVNCARAIHAAIPDCRISVVTLAVTRHIAVIE